MHLQVTERGVHEGAGPGLVETGVAQRIPWIGVFIADYKGGA